VGSNQSEAIKWLRAAADKGHAEAQYNLAWRYAHGDGVELDDPEALLWLQKSAAQGESRALSALGMRYAKGQGVPTDYALAYMWSDLAISQFTPEEADLRSAAERNRAYAASNMTPAQVAEAQLGARRWLQENPFKASSPNPLG